MAAAGLLAAAIAALPSLDWCPLGDWRAVACEVRAEAITPCGSRDAAYAVDAPPCASAESHAAACAREPFCDPEPDPLPWGDRLWCIRPPVSALGAKADPLATPGPSSSFALAVDPPVLPPPLVVTLARAAPLPQPPHLREAHAPPQPRAPPAA